MTKLTIPELLSQAIHYHQAGKLEEAEALYQQVLSQDSGQADAWNLLGVIACQCGYPQDGAEMIQTALALNPHSATFYNNLGNALKSLDKMDQAIHSFRQALQLAPDLVDAHNNLGNMLLGQGQIAEAIQHYQLCLQWAPDFAEGHNNLGNALKEAGQLETALCHYQQAIQLNPEYAAAHYNLASACRQLERWDEALFHFRYNLQLKPDDIKSWQGLGHTLAEQGETELALEAYQQAERLQPQAGNTVRLALLLPPIYRDWEDIKWWRGRLSRELDALLEKSLMIHNPLQDVGSTLFYLAYQGLNDRDIQQQLARLYRPLLPEQVGPLAMVQRGEPLRIGFISCFFYNHSVAGCFSQLIQQCVQAGFEVTLFLAGSCSEDDMTEQLKTSVQHCVRLPYRLDKARELILAQQLHGLIYTDIGMEPFTYFLAFTRLAPIQLVLAGHPVTTGIPTVDYFVSSQLLEIPEAQAHYSEKLLLLEQLPVNYPRPPVPLRIKDRTELGLNPLAHLYVCPMTPFKIHPDFDSALANILHQDPKAEICFFHYGRTALITQQLQQRFLQHMAEEVERIHFLPWASTEDFMSILSQAEVILDSFYFGAGSTAYLAFAVGTPMVTLPSPYLRGRSAYAMYHMMNLYDCIADTPTTYVEIACQIGTDPEFRHQLKQQILAKNAILYDNPVGVQEFITFLQDTLGELRFLSDKN